MHIYQVLVSALIKGAIKYITQRKTGVVHANNVVLIIRIFLYTVKPMVVSLRAQRITVQMFYFRLTVDPDVLVWVHAIFLFSLFFAFGGCFNFQPPWQEACAHWLDGF